MQTVGNRFKACGFNPLNANALDYNKCLRTSASASRLTVKVEIRKMSYILLWIITLVKITLRNKNLRNSKNKKISFRQNWRFLETILHAGELRRGGPVSRPGHSMWDLWWTKWKWDRFFSEFLGFPLSICNSTVVLQTHNIWGKRNMLT
jgi:hypothetical protein